MFKRRDKRGTKQTVLEAIYPPGGWGRAISYLYHRLRRLPDPPHRVARGVAAGVFVSFTPFFGLHFLLAALLAWVARGNILASALGTFAGNPVTFPLIAVACMQLGNAMLGREGLIQFHDISHAFGDASRELWWNGRTLFNGAPAHWDKLGDFYRDVFLPYLLGGGVLGLVATIACYGLAHQMIDAYQRRRSRLLQQRLQQRLKIRAGAVAE